MTAADRSLDAILGELTDLAACEAASQITSEEIVALARDNLDCDYAGLTLLRGRALVTVAPTDPVVAKADTLQYELQEGPCYDAALAQAPVTVLSTDVASDARWPRWGAHATALGLCSLLAARLDTGDGPLGALHLYATRPRAFSCDDLSLAHVFALHAAAALARTEQVETPRAALDSRTLIGQAQGVLMERYGIDASQAFGVLSRYARAHHVKLRAVAEPIVGSREHPDAIATPVPDVAPSSARSGGRPDARGCAYRDDQLTIDRTDDGLRLVGEIDTSNIGSVRRLLIATAVGVEGPEVCLDVSRLTFIGVDGIRELAHFAARLDGRELRILVTANSEIRELARICGWTRLLAATWQEVPDGSPER